MNQIHVSPEAIERHPANAISRASYWQYVKILWSGRFPIAAATAIGLLFGIALVHVLPAEFEAALVVRPPDANAGGLGAASGLLSQVGGGGLSHLLSGSGDLFSGADQSNFDEFSTLIDSNALSDRIAQKHLDVLRGAFSSNWNDAAKRWEQPPVIGVVKDVLRAIFGLPPWHAPNGEDLKEYLSKRVDTSTDFKTGMLTISYSAKDPAFAKEVVSILHKEADAIVRAKELDRSTRRIEYLQKTLPQVDQIDMRAVLTQLLASEEKKLMTVEADEYFAAWPVDAPIVPQRPSSPPVVFILLASAVVGFGVGCAYVLFGPSILAAWRDDPAHPLPSK